MNQDLREKVALLCQDRGYYVYKENGFVFVMDPIKRLKIYFMSPKKVQKNMLSVNVVIKEQYMDGKWEVIGRKSLETPIITLKYNVDRLLDDIENHFLLSATQSKEQQNLRAELERIARKHLSIETLKTRNSDSLDFYDVSVWGVEAALKEAYNLGLKDKNK